MDERSITLVEESYRKLLPISEQAGAIFVTRLRDRHHQAYVTVLRLLEADAGRAVPLLGAVVENLRSRERLVSALQGVLHTKDIEHLLEFHTAAVEIAIIWALRRSLRSQFTTETEAAWINVISSLSMSATIAKAQFATRRPSNVTLH